MKELRKSHETEKEDANRPDFRISVTNFGPVKSGHVDLRPLTVFVGPSNTGKTYFAILIYALHRILNGFRRLPVTNRYRYFYVDQARRTDRSTRQATVEQDFQDALAKLLKEVEKFKFSDLPKGVRDTVRAVLRRRDALGADFTAELQRCFDLDSVSDLIRMSGSTDMKVSLSATEEARSLWHFQTEVSNKEVLTNGRIGDVVLLPKGLPKDEIGYLGGLGLLQRAQKEKRSHDLLLRSHSRFDVFEELLFAALGKSDGQTHYLPAARSGIMQSHRVIASSLVARSTRGGLEPFPELPTFSGVMTDFMQRLILYEERSERDESLKDLASALEQETLGGQIVTRMPKGGGYPEFVYRPKATEREIRLTRASSMVSELAPVVLFLRGAVSSGDMLIVEEPEAHLHPAAQTQMAGLIARLVRAGVRVVVTTHSDWLLKEIGNLLREGELEEQADLPESESSHSYSLLPKEVGVWLFREEDDSSGSTVEEIPFNRSEGVEPEDYEDVAEALYNRSANLQNRLEGLGRGAERERA